MYKLIKSIKLKKFFEFDYLDLKKIKLNLNLYEYFQLPPDERNNFEVKNNRNLPSSGYIKLPIKRI